MRTQKKENQEPTPQEGVFGSSDGPVNGLQTATLIYPAKDEQILEMFKHFYQFIREEDVISMHIEMAKMFRRLLVLYDEFDGDIDFFETKCQQITFMQTLDFLGKIASEEAMTFNWQRKKGQEPTGVEKIVN